MPGTLVETESSAGTYLQIMWDQAADWWAQHLREDKNRRLQVFPAVLRMLGDPRGLRVLDAGCGEGTFARMLADAGGRVTGIDFSRLLNMAVDLENKKPRGIRYLKADITNPPAALAGEFDAVVCNLVLHCFPCLNPAVAALHRLLRPGGQLIVSELHPETFSFFARAWTKCVPLGGNEYRYALSPECPELTLYLHSAPEFQAAFARNGFRCAEHLAPCAGETGRPQFVYYRLEKDTAAAA